MFVSVVDMDGCTKEYSPRDFLESDMKSKVCMHAIFFWIKGWYTIRLWQIEIYIDFIVWFTLAHSLVYYTVQQRGCDYQNVQDHV